VANLRTLEQKISDAGPNPQRIDPHILTDVRRRLEAEGVLLRIPARNTSWFYLASTDNATVQARLTEQLAVHDRLQERGFLMRQGQALEIAVFRSLLEQNQLSFLGNFLDLDEHDDSTSYSKEEPPSSLDGRKSRGKLDFILTHKASSISVGLEAKNTREWLYPDRSEVTELLHKCCALDIVPMLVARRIQFATFSVLGKCGVIIHETYNQRFPAADAELAALAKDKRLLGYHDIKLGNQPDARLMKMMGENLPTLIPEMRERFDRYKDLLQAYGDKEIDYKEFAARARRREHGLPEDSDREEPDDY
jgi:hypothetical protein